MDGIIFEITHFLGPITVFGAISASFFIALWYVLYVCAYYHQIYHQVFSLAKRKTSIHQSTAEKKKYIYLGQSVT